MLATAVEQRRRGVVGARGLLHHPLVGEGGDRPSRRWCRRKSAGAPRGSSSPARRAAPPARPPRRAASRPPPRSPRALRRASAPPPPSSPRRRPRRRAAAPAASRRSRTRSRRPAIRRLQVRAAAQSQCATRIAPRQVPAPQSGVAREGSIPLTCAGSKTITSPERLAAGDGVGQQVALDRGGQHRPLPLQQGRDRQAGGLVALGRREDDHRLALLGGEQGAPAAPERQPPRLRPGHPQRRQVAAARPAGARRAASSACRGEAARSGSRSAAGEQDAAPRRGEDQRRARVEAGRPRQRRPRLARPGGARVAEVGGQAQRRRQQFARCRSRSSPAPKASPAKAPVSQIVASSAAAMAASAEVELALLAAHAASRCSTMRQSV